MPLYRSSRGGNVFGRERSPTAKVQSTKADLDMISQKKSAMSQVPKQVPEGPLPLRALLTRPVLVSVSSYALLDMAAVMMVLIPLVWATSVELSRLDLNPAVQFTQFPHVVAHLTRHVFLTSVLDALSVDIQVLI
ncbi:hypothetical protein EDB86DRAFT_3082800 [Lactarius hatsudake]|nr:hypothetical protein EDB86DRAFT_3082800 [Lactarius hatsudake]